MSQNFDTTIGLSADFSSAGQPFDFDGAFVTNLVITNNAGVGIQYTADGTIWTTINPAGSATPAVPDSTTFYLRKMAAGGAPASVRLTWRARDSLDPSSVAITGGTIGANITDRANTIVLLGDSISAYNGGPSIATPSNFWDSKGFFVWGNTLLGGRLRMVNNAGVAGQTSAQILARYSADVAALAPGWVNVMAGRNDDGVTTGQLTADTIANLTAIYQQCLKGGSRVVACTILPGATSDTASKIQHDNDVNRWIRDYCRSTAGMYFVDLGAAVVDVTTNWRSLASCTVPDRIHPNSPGAALMGARWAAVMGQFIPPNDLLAGGTGTENFIANPYFNGSGTTAPTSWSVSSAPTMSYVARTDGIQGSWFQAIVAAAGGSTITQNVSLTGALAVGAQCYLTVEVQAASLDAAPAANTQAFHAFLQCYNGSTFTTKAYAAYWDTGYVNVPFPGTSGVFVTSALTIPAGTTLVQPVITMNGGGTYRIGRAALRVGTP